MRNKLFLVTCAVLASLAMTACAGTDVQNIREGIVDLAYEFGDEPQYEDTEWISGLGEIAGEGTVVIAEDGTINAVYAKDGAIGMVTLYVEQIHTRSIDVWSVDFYYFSDDDHAYIALEYYLSTFTVKSFNYEYDYIVETLGLLKLSDLVWMLDALGYAI